MAVSSGSYTVGSGGDYATWAAALTDIATPLTGDLSFTQISDTVEPGIDITTLPASHNTAGYTVTFDSDSPHGGDPTAGWKSEYTTFNINQRFVFFFRPSGGGNCEAKNLKFISSHSGGGAAVLVTVNAVTNMTTKVHDNIAIGRFAGATNQDIGFNCVSSGSANAELGIWNCTACGHDRGFTLAARDGSSMTVENLTAHDSVGQNEGNGIYFFTFGITSTMVARNCVAFDSGVEDFTFNLAGTVNGYNNATEDATAQDSNWSTGTDNITGITPANEFSSTSTSSSNYLRVINRGVCYNSGASTTITDNTTGIRGNARPHAPSTYSIGADEYAAMPSPSPGMGSGGGLSGAITAAMAMGY